MEGADTLGDLAGKCLGLADSVTTFVDSGELLWCVRWADACFAFSASSVGNLSELLLGRGVSKICHPDLGYQGAPDYRRIVRSCLSLDHTDGQDWNVDGRS